MSPSIGPTFGCCASWSFVALPEIPRSVYLVDDALSATSAGLGPTERQRNLRRTETSRYRNLQIDGLRRYGLGAQQFTTCSAFSTESSRASFEIDQ